MTLLVCRVRLFGGVAIACVMAWERNWVCLGDADECFWEQDKPDHLFTRLVKLLIVS